MYQTETPQKTIELPLRPAGRTPPPGPQPLFACSAPPGSAEKISVMTARASLGLPLTNARDANLPVQLAYLPVARLRMLDDCTGAAAVVEELPGGQGELRLVGEAKGPVSTAKQLTRKELLARQGEDPRSFDAASSVMSDFIRKDAGRVLRKAMFGVAS